ncbi:MAG: DUF6495 family protein [Cytophagaceae bacterium]
MPKYRHLTFEELQELEKEFIDFLVLNSITAEDWVKMKKKSPEHAGTLLELFSDVVFESILRKIQFLELRTPKELISCQCLEEQMVIVGMKAPASSNADFTDQNYIQQAFLNPPAELKVYTKTKKYLSDRQTDLFAMTEAGYTITDGKLFKTLSLSLPLK